MMPRSISQSFSLLLILSVLPAALWATHNRAGHIEVAPVDPLCENPRFVRAVITTYTKTSSVPADRDTLTICWGDGTCERVARANGIGNPPQGVPLENDVKFNQYIAFHTYESLGRYVISMTDPNRNGGILNVNFPNSDAIKFHIQTTYTIPSPQFSGCNSSPILTVPPIDIGCVGKVFTHNPGAFDPDGDSLSFHFIVPLQEANLEVPQYLFPNQIDPIPGQDSLLIDEETGDITWKSPQKAGEYNLAIIIVSYRDGVPLDTVIRDMQILVEECDNLPPELAFAPQEICVIAGELFEMQVTGTAPAIETGQRVRLEAFGLPFELPVSPATFTPEGSGFEPQPVVKTFRWQTTCDHISGQYYTVVFKATDNFFGDTTGLATLRSFRIKVIGPPPEDLQAEAEPERISLSWESPYVCEEPANRFQGFTVWRREDTPPITVDTCNPGLTGKGYDKLTPVGIQDEENGRFVFFDSDVERGRTYCYRVQAEFAQPSAAGGFPFNLVEGLPTAEICIQLARDLPLITNVDVQTTDATDGRILVKWTKPLPEDLDTLLNGGPYTYELLRAPGITSEPADFIPIGVSFTSPTFAGANDTLFTDAGLNTAGQAYSYRINFFVNGEPTPLGASNPASSVFLNISPTDNRNELSWEEDVPWENFEYVVYRLNENTNQFDSLTTVTEPFYTDDGLVNGREYCYKIEAVGSYNIEGVASPLINFSQETCGMPFDNVAPCPPDTLIVSNICDQGIRCSDEDLLFNSLSWSNPNETCPETDDVVRYNVYYAPFEGSDFSLVAVLDSARSTTFDHKPDVGIAGCYAVTALDSVGNESAFSPVVCVDNCPFYELPNAFTPNGDGSNDLFKPFPFCFVERVNFQVYNRWGQLVFETEDPDLNWDGTNFSGQDVEEGVYYYVCKVFERRVGGILPTAESLSGYIQLVRGSN